MTRHLHAIARGIPMLFIPAPWRKDAPPYAAADLRADVLAGFTVAIILIPQAMALALIAGLPAAYGLYASLPGFIASLWGSSRHLSTGPVAIVSFLVLTSLIPLAQPGTPEFITLAAALALLVGVLQLLMGMLRLGFVMHLVPHSVIAGFSSAAAAIIVITQIPTLLGYSYSQHEFVFQNILEIGARLPETAPVTLIVGLCAVAFLLACKRLPKTFPSTLVLLAAAIAASHLLQLGERGVSLVQAIPAALPSFSFPAIGAEAFFSLLPKAAIVAFVGFVEAHAIAKAVAQKTGQQLDTNQELVGQGLANIAGGFFKGYPTSGSFLRTAVNVEAGAKTGVAAAVTAIVTVVVLLYLSPILGLLPRAVLAAIVIVSALSLVNLRTMREMYGVFKVDGIIAYTTFAIAFILKPDDAIFVGIVLALILFVRQTVWGVQVAEMGIDPRWNVLKGVRESPKAEALPGCLIVRPGMSLYYANAAYIIDQIKFLTELHRTREVPLRAVVVDFSGVNFIDITGLEVLGEYFRSLQKSGTAPAAIYLRRQVRTTLAAAHEFPDIPVFHNLAQMREWHHGGSDAWFDQLRADRTP